MFRPFRAGDLFDDLTQGVALGYRIWPRWGGQDQFVKSVRAVGVSAVSLRSACGPLGAGPGQFAESVRAVGPGTVVVPCNQCVDPHAGLEGLRRGIGFF